MVGCRTVTQDGVTGPASSSSVNAKQKWPLWLAGVFRGRWLPNTPIAGSDLGGGSVSDRSSRASAGCSTGVLPVRTTWVGPRTEAAASCSASSRRWPSSSGSWTQPLSAAALQAAVNAAAQQAPANPTRQRSKGRLWGGVGMMGAGVRSSAALLVATVNFPFVATENRTL